MPSGIYIRKEVNRKCCICGKTSKRLGYHLSMVHKITSKEYYDEYCKKDKEGACKECGKLTGFNGFARGYDIYCSTKCAAVRRVKENKPWNYGLNKENDSRVAQYGKVGSETLKRKYASGEIKAWMTGLTKESDSRVAECSFRLQKCRLGKPNPNPKGYGKYGRRKDLNNQFFRSTWEANFARILEYLDMSWEYEPQNKRIRFDSCSYLPDFYLPALKLFVEVKGARFEKRSKKIAMLYEKDPNFPIKIIDKEVYKKLTKMYKNKIENWEK